MSKKQTQHPITQLQKLNSALPHGSKSEIARKLKVEPYNVQNAFRGMTGETLTKKVLREAQKILARKKIIRLTVIKRVTVMQ